MQFVGCEIASVSATVSHFDQTQPPPDNLSASMWVLDLSLLLVMFMCCFCLKRRHFSLDSVVIVCSPSKFMNYVHMIVLQNWVSWNACLQEENWQTNRSFSVHLSCVLIVLQTIVEWKCWSCQYMLFCNDKQDTVSRKYTSFRDLSCSL